MPATLQRSFSISVMHSTHCSLIDCEFILFHFINLWLSKFDTINVQKHANLFQRKLFGFFSFYFSLQETIMLINGTKSCWNQKSVLHFGCDKKAQVIKRQCDKNWGTKQISMLNWFSLFFFFHYSFCFTLERFFFFFLAQNAQSMYMFSIMTVQYQRLWQIKVHRWIAHNLTIRPCEMYEMCIR